MFKKLVKNQKGMLALELALWLPLIIGIMILGLTLGKLAYSKMACELAAREAARAYAVNYGIASDCDLIARQAAEDNMENILPLKPEYFNSSTDVTVQQINDYVQVEVAARIPIEVPFIKRILTSVGGPTDDDPIGTKTDNGYVQKITGVATFKKEVIQ